MAAMNALVSGARGGVDIPEKDRRAVYDHLAKHYADFGKEPPDYKLIELGGMIDKLSGWKAGRVLSARNLERLQQALSVLNEILLAAVPPEDDEANAKVIENMLLEVQIAERELSLI